MSYCRWSSDDFQCDVYVYESVRGWETHVATYRLHYKSSLPPRITLRKGDEVAWMEREEKIMKMREEADKQLIGLKYDGESFLDASPGECAKTLEMLQDEGYNVPDYAIETLKEEGEEI